jgi:H+/Cl- antiporter ClcA
MILKKFSESVDVLKYLLKWCVISSLVAVLSGTASAALLLSLEWATKVYTGHLWMIGLLPLAGLIVGAIYHYFGARIDRGNNLLIDEIHDPKKVIPFRMAPFVYIGNVVSILFGASVGREGTAVQMGGSLADQLTRIFKLSSESRRIVLMSGISAGFASVFGTPLAGAVFGLEVLVVGRIRYDALLPCLLSAVMADQVSLLWGVHHTQYAVAQIPSLTFWTLFAIVTAGAAFGLTARLFANVSHFLSDLFKQYIHYPPMRPFLGGLLIVLMVWIIGSERYTGLGVPVISESFTHLVLPYDFAIKFSMTVLSLASGFKGGEVTPLFYIGSTLGNALAPILNMPFSLLAGVGFVSVFAGAANTPISSMIMATELFGVEVGVYAGIACVVSYLFSGQASIYKSQRLDSPKHDLNTEQKKSKLPTK